jgi:hypothetical protein
MVLNRNMRVETVLLDILALAPHASSALELVSPEDVRVVPRLTVLCLIQVLPILKAPSCGNVDLRLL